MCVTPSDSLSSCVFTFLIGRRRGNHFGFGLSNS